jgi:hypothetical protein
MQFLHRFRKNGFYQRSFPIEFSVHRISIEKLAIVVLCNMLHTFRRHLYHSSENSMTSKLDTDDMETEGMEEFRQDLQNRMARLDIKLINLISECPAVEPEKIEYVLMQACYHLSYNAHTANAGKKVVETNSGWIWGVVYQILNIFELSGDSIPKLRAWVQRLNEQLPITIDYDLFEWYHYSLTF